MMNFVEELSEKHSRNIILACQETWQFDIPQLFKKQLCDKYLFLHESAMDATVARKRGRPFGGVCLIISKSVAFKLIYSNARCLSVLLTDHNMLLNNVYLPFDDSRTSTDSNVDSMLQALGHLGAAQSLASETSDYITVGDFNAAPKDRARRTQLLNEWLADCGYKNVDLTHSPENDYTHQSGRRIDRMVTTNNATSAVETISIPKECLKSDHFPVISKLRIAHDTDKAERHTDFSVCWHKASTEAINSYSCLANRKCTISLKKYNKGYINVTELYEELVANLEESALTCLPKSDPCRPSKKHNIPMWKERMGIYKHEVDYWLQLQFLNGGPGRCGEFIKMQLRITKSNYRRQLRQLRREIEVNIAESTTITNCFRRLTKPAKSPKPAIIDGHSRLAQPVMWQKHLKATYMAEQTPYVGNLLTRVETLMTDDVKRNYDSFDFDEVNRAIGEINTNKSYKRHHHWKYLRHDNHSAKACLIEVFKHWVGSVMQGQFYADWDLFLTNVSFIPKRDKKDLSSKKSWRPISIGTSENWLLEKMILYRVYPYLQTRDCQFGYKPGHSTAHAIEIVRILERRHDAHVCLLDATSAFDKLSWHRIYDQLLKRHVPICLIKIIMTQLFSTKISVCGTSTIFPRAGVKQGGILSGVLFSSCYDDLVFALDNVLAGVMLNSANNTRKLIRTLIYADDIVLVAASPNGLKSLIETTFQFAERYHDISFNPSKSCILRLGPHRRPPVSVCGITTSETHKYLGVEIGRDAHPDRNAAAKLYTNANVLLAQNRELNKCSVSIKNTCVYAYGNVYSLENMLSVNSKVRAAHRYLTMSVHNDWARVADLPGPNIRSRTLYTWFNLDSLEVMHRKRRNTFLLKAALHENRIISNIIGQLDRITI